MDDILLIVPTEREAASFADHGLEAHICGVGMAECAATTAHLLAEAIAAGTKPTLAILAGIAGTYTETLKIGDTVAVESETIVDLGRQNPDGTFTPLFQKTYKAGSVPEGLPVAIGYTVNTAGGNRRVELSGMPDKSGSDEVVIENMEGAAFLALCEKFNIPAAEIRTISNRVGEPVTPESLDHAARSLAAALRTLFPSKP